MLIGSKPIGTIAYMGGLPAVLEAFSYSLLQMVVHSQEVLCAPKQYIHIAKAKYTDHAPARNDLAAHFLGDWLLQLDTDHIFEPDLLVRLLHRAEAIGADVMTGLYRFKSPPYTPVLYTWHDEKLLPIASFSPGASIIEVGSAGAGCLLVKRTIFERITKDLGEAPFDRLAGFSEDHSFFLRLRKLGIKAYCDTRIECGHLRPQAVGPEHEDFTGFVVSEQAVPVGGFG